MKRTTTMMIATAALLAAAATGSAQSMKAEIPFRFDAGGAHMQPGTYQVHLNHTTSGTYILQIFNNDDRRSTFALAQTVERPSRTAAGGSDIVLTFQCTDGHCALSRLWDGSTSGYGFATGKAGASTHVAMVILHAVHGD